MNNAFKLIAVISVVFLSLIAGVSLAGGTTIRETFKKEFSLETGGRVGLQNTNGSITVSSWNRDRIRIEAVKKVKAGSRADAEELMQKIEIDIEHDGDYIRIDTHIPKRRSDGFWAALFSNSGDISVSYEITVPERVNLELHTVNGKVEVQQVAGEIAVETTNGAITMYEVEGSVNAKTTNGAIAAELMEYYKNKDMRLKTTNGSITVTFPEDFAADIEAKTTNGSIKTDFAITVQGELDRRRLSGHINGGGSDVQLYTTNGSIRILEQ